MDIIVFTGLLFFSLVLSYLYFSRNVIYFGVLAAVIFIFIGASIAGNGSIDNDYCFSNRINQTITGNDTFYSYSTVCHSEALSVDRDFLNALGTILMLVGAGMVVSFGFDINAARKKVWQKQ